MIYVCVVLALVLAVLCLLERRREAQESKLWREMWDGVRADTRRMHLEDEKAGFTPRRSLAQEMEGLSQWEAEASRLRSR